MATQNKSIGQFNLEGIVSVHRGVPQIEVTLDIDVSSILNISVRDKITGKEQKIRTEASSGLNREETSHMEAEVEQNTTVDKAERKKIDKMNQADSMIFTTENFLKDNGDRIPADQKPNIESALRRLKGAHKNTDVAAIDVVISNLNTVMQVASVRIYSQTGGTQPGVDIGFSAGIQQASDGQ